MIQTYLNDYLSQNVGFSVQLATLLLLMYGLGSAAGVVGGGLLGQWLYNRRKEYMVLLIVVSMLLGIPPLIYLINAPLTE
jgi:predicted MFS family arabinose efflux permease